MKRFAVILSGCGVFDGSEIHEATLLLLAIKKAGCDYTIFAPNREQSEVINHFSGATMPERRNILAESGRIARKNVEPLENLNPEKFDAIVLPGGLGAVKNLSDYFYKGYDFDIIPELKKILLEAYELKKPIGATCIAPVLLTKIFAGCKITLGENGNDSEAAVRNGATHVVTAHGETVTDEKYKLVTTPCYMLDADIVQIAEGTHNLVKELLKFF